jgi:hypothetical protein
MAVKMLTTKKHSKMAKAINTIKEANKPIEVVKEPKKVVEPKAKKKVKTNKLIQKKPIVFEKADPKNMLEKLITKRQYDNALRVIKQYEREKGLKVKNGINLYKEISVRVANRLCVYFREKGIELDMVNFDVAYLKHINLSEINQMRNFGKGSLHLLKEYLEKQK